MKVRFYFDYSDYRSYLMMHVLDEFAGLPVQVEWIVVDAYSLRALSGIILDDNLAKRRSMRQAAERFCLVEGLGFVWREEKMHSGLALRCGLWMMQHGRKHFEVYSREVLTALWCRGAEMDVSLLRDIVASLGFELEEILDEAMANTGFEFQDVVLQEALSDGVFDVATLVIGTSIFQHFDNREVLRRLAMTEWLRGMPADRISHAFVELLLEHKAEKRAAVIEGLSQTRSEKPAKLLGVDKKLAAIRHELNTPDDRWQLERNSVKTELQVQYCAGNGKDKLLSAFEKSVDNAVNICTDLDLPCPDIGAFLALSKRRMGTRLFCALVRRDGFQGVLVLRVDLRGDIQDEVFLSDAPDAAQSYWTTLRGWHIGIFAPKISRDLHMARLGAHRGANLLLRLGAANLEAMSEAWACVARAWVADIGENASVIDSESRRSHVGQEGSLRISSSYKLKNGELWRPPASRTLLLCENPLSFGELSEGADLELACRGENLEVSTAMQKSEISSSRASERIRIGKALLQMIPLNGEQIYVIELLSHKILETLNRSPREALPLIVNYWSELEFEWLEIMRPVLSSIVATWQMPIVLVVGHQVAEVWLPSAQGSAYRVEKDDDHYVIDVAEMQTVEGSYGKMLVGLDIDGNDFLERLGQIAAVKDKL